MESKTIGLAVTGSAIAADHVRQVIDVLSHEWNCRVVADELSLAQAGSAEQRSQQFIQLMCDDCVDAIWIVRGGEGSADILPYLHTHQKEIQNLTPKPVIGLSDTTAVLLYLLQQYQWPVSYGIGAGVLAKSEQYCSAGVAQVRQLLLNHDQSISIDALTPLNPHALAGDTITARCCVGNMSLLAISIKDLWEFSAVGKILMIEDWHEKGYIVDRTMKYLQRIGKLDGIKALIFGDMAAGRFSVDDVEQSKQVQYLQRVLKRFAQTCSFPVLSTEAFGHGYQQTPLPMFVDAELSCGLEPRLLFKTTLY